MKKRKLYVLFPLIMVVLMLSLGSCFVINVPQGEGQQGGVQSKSPVINAFSASPANITAGGSSTLSWQVTGATTVSISPNIGNVALAGSTAVSPSAGTAYLLTATNGAGSVTAVAQVSVEAASPPSSGSGISLPVIDSFVANPATILIGGSSTLSWGVSNVISVTINPGIGTVAPAGSKSVSPGATTTYTLTATNSAGWRSKSITVTATTIKMFIPVTPMLVLAAFEDKTWVLEKIGQADSPQDALAGKEVSARFDSGTDKVSGNAGCNGYSASYLRDFNNISVSGLTSTMMLCMPNNVMQQESAFKNALTGAQSCKITGGKLEISCTANRILIFHPK